jgi:hypothetical protein
MRTLTQPRVNDKLEEDRLIPDHIIPIKELDPLLVAEGDRRDFATILASAKHATISFSRRDVEGRLLDRSPLIGDFKEEIYVSRGRIPDHAARHCWAAMRPS